MFAHHEVRLGVGAAVTDRRGGVSAGAWASLNLGDHVGDRSADVIANRRRVLDGLGCAGHSLVTMRQVHGADVAVIDAAPSEPPAADVLVTTCPGLVLTVLVADCTPLLLWDRRARVVAAAHVGRRGLAAGVVAAAVAAMVDRGARADRISGVVGPGICVEHYEVPGSLRDEVARAVPGTAATTSGGSPAVDLRSGLLRQLQDLGVRPHVAMPQCTAETDALYSFRRDGRTGRFAGLVWLDREDVG